MYHRILIPVREPSEVEPLIRFGAQLLDADGEICTLHVIPSASLPEVTREWRRSVSLVVPAHETAAALDIRVDPEVRASTDVPGEIIETAETRGVDAILMTLRADRRSVNPFVGHMASAMLHHATCDVLVVNRLALAEERVSRILIPTFSASPPPKALRIGEEIAVRSHGLPLVTLTMASRDAMVSDLSGPGRTPRGLPLVTRRSFFSAALLGRRRRLPELILAQAARERYGLLIVGEEGAHPSAPLLTRSFLDELFRSAPCPVIAVRG
jgi:nucleotide-binding universal stress UspA family protein